MHEIKPTLAIAQQISRRHTLISLSITLPLLMATILISIIVLKLLGYAQAGMVLKQFYTAHQKNILWVLAFLHFIPINFYAIKKVFRSDFKDFALKITAKEATKEVNTDTLCD